MKLTLAFVVYTFVWWITLFAVLPFFARSQEDEGEIVPGTPESAPAKVNMLRIFLINTLVATIVFAFVELVIVNHWSIDVTTLFEKANTSSPVPPQ